MTNRSSPRSLTSNSNGDLPLPFPFPFSFLQRSDPIHRAKIATQLAREQRDESIVLEKSLSQVHQVLFLYSFLLPTLFIFISFHSNKTI